MNVFEFSWLSINKKFIKKLPKFGKSTGAIHIVLIPIVYQLLKSEIPESILYIWFGSIFVIAIPRLLILLPQIASKLGPKRITLAFSLLTILQALSWSCGIVYLSGSLSIQNELPLILIVAGLTAGGAAVLFTTYSLYCAYTLSLMAPIIIDLLSRGDSYYVILAALSIIFVVTMLISAAGFNRSYKKLYKQGTFIENIFNATQDISFITCNFKGNDLEIVSFSFGSEVLFECKNADIINRPLRSIFSEKDYQNWHDILLEVRDKGCIKKDEATLINKYGKSIDIVYSIYPLFDENHIVFAALMLMTDVTESKAAEKEKLEHLDKIRQRQTAVMELATSELIAEGDLILAARTITESVASILGVKRISIWLFREDRSQMQCVDLFETSLNRHSEGMTLDVSDYPAYFRYLEVGRVIDANDAQTDSRTREFANHYLSSFGITSMLDATIRVSGEVIGVLCCEHIGPKRIWNSGEIAFAGEMADQAAQVLTNRERKKTEKELRESRQMLKLVLDTIPARVFWKDHNLVYMGCNRVFALDAGMNSPEEIIGKVDFQLNWKKDAAAYRADDLQVIQTGQPKIKYEEQQTDQNNKVSWLCTSKIPLKDSNGEISGVLGTYEVITEQKRAEELLIQSEKKYRTFVESMHEGVVFADLKENVVYANQGLSKLLGYNADELIGMNFRELVKDGEIDIIYRETQRRINKEYSRYELTIKRKDGQFRQVVVSATPLLDNNGHVNGTVGVFSDITELKMAESEKQELREKLARAQRMESLGVLAGGVAHDLNNILGPLVAYPELIRMKLPPDSNIKNEISRIEKSAQRAADVVQDLLTMARRGRYEMSPQDINELIESYLQSADFINLKSKVPEIEITTALDNSNPKINGSASHVFKVIMNLVINAFDAMPYGGRLHISTQTKFMERLIGGYDNIERGDYIVLTVSDTGVGIEKKDFKRIFEPFYTKKEMGRSGSGLGLAIVYGVIKDHNGYIDVTSEVGQGSQFTIYIPLSKGTPTEAKMTVADIRGCESILVVDDIEEQRELASTVLTSLGYTVATAANGRKAVEHIKNSPADIVILDMIMEPDFDGLDTYREIIKHRPGQRAIIASGFSETDRVKEAERLGVGKYIKKPYNMQILGKAIRELMIA